MRNSINKTKNRLPASCLFAFALLFAGTMVNAQTGPGGVSTGLSLWLKADVGTSTTTQGTALTSWTDQSLAGNTINNASSGTAGPTYQVTTAKLKNFNPTVNFNGSQYLSRSTNVLQVATGYSTFLAGIQTVGTRAMFSQPSTVWNTASPELAQDVSYNSHTSGGFYTQNATTSANTNKIASCMFDATAVRGYKYNEGVGGSPANPMAMSALVPSSVAGGMGFALGVRPSVAFASGDMSEVIAYTAPLSATNLAKVESYLAIKYGVSLNNGTGYAYINSAGASTWNNTTNAGYNNSVAGIARDDSSTLNQKQSQSSYGTGLQVVMSLGTAATTNQLNAGTFTSNLQSFVWGDDNGSITTFTATGLSAVPQRLTRIWKTQNTGSFAQASTIYYPVSAFGNSATSAVNLIYGASAAALSNGTASLITQSGTTTINGVSYYAFAIPAGTVANLNFYSFTTMIINPGGVTGHSLWYKADGGVTTSGALVTQWKNQSSTYFDQLQPTVANQPTYNSAPSLLFNFNPTLTFDGTTDYMNSAISPTAIDLAKSSTFTVFNPNTSSTYRDIYSSLNSVTGWDMEYRFSDGSGSTLEFGHNGASYNAIFSNSGAAPNSVQSLNSFIYTAGASAYFSNGTAFGTTTTTLNTITVQDRVGIGTRIGGGANNPTPKNDYLFNGRMGEVIHYSTNLSTLQRQQVECYLAIKYGHTLPYNYLASDGTTTTYAISGYANSIAGIGRDDNTALLQKQSQSITTGSQVVMALGTVATSNLLNTGNIPTDNQFFVWGNDTGSATTTTTISGLGTVTQRLTRVWKTQNTNALNQQITVYYPVSSFTAFGTTPYLIYATTAALLNTGATAIANSGTVSINGVSNYAFTVPASRLGNMNFFSFGITNVPLSTQRTHVLVNPATINSSQQNGRVK
ncbi:hypothetical protein [uncultured Flavobacterium sp.]|uniref:hypothetical protein n=1 Tax=uncultured Flavobacterium sp. TaxID=165435 RepID=UPI0025FF0EC7|nr:hypothetical protein [uncultured Flavobacterium sp.]